MEYASPVLAQHAGRRVPRWVVVGATTVGLAYVVGLAVVALTDPQPARAARGLARENAYPAVLACACTAACIVLRQRDTSRNRPWRSSRLAASSATVAVLNPAIVELAFGAVGVHGIGGGGDSELYSFTAGLAALTGGIIAAVRIRRSQGSVGGMPYAATGIVGGGVWVCFWSVFALVFAAGMAGFR